MHKEQLLLSHSQKNIVIGVLIILLGAVVVGFVAIPKILQQKRLSQIQKIIQTYKTDLNNSQNSQQAKSNLIKNLSRLENKQIQPRKSFADLPNGSGYCSGYYDWLVVLIQSAHLNSDVNGIWSAHDNDTIDDYISFLGSVGCLDEAP